MAEDRWVFEVPHDGDFEHCKKHMSQGRAWRRCWQAGLLVGIPKHAWRKRHDYNEGDGRGFFRYVTTDYATIDRVTEMLKARAEDNPLDAEVSTTGPLLDGQVAAGPSVSGPQS